MNNHARSTLTRPVGKPFSHINARLSCPRGRVVSGFDRLKTERRGTQSCRVIELLISLHDSCGSQMNEFLSLSFNFYFLLAELFYQRIFKISVFLYSSSWVVSFLQACFEITHVFLKSKLRGTFFSEALTS